MKKLNEKRVNPDLLKLNTSQKRVLMKTVEAGDPKRAAEDVAASSDSRNLMPAVKILASYGLLATYPEDLGHDDEPEEIELTDEGQQHADDYNVTDDPALRTDDETEESEPGPGPAEPGTGGEEMGLGNVGAELGKPPSNGDDMGLELSSYFREIHNWTRILKD